MDDEAVCGFRYPEDNIADTVSSPGGGYWVSVAFDLQKLMGRDSDHVSWVRKARRVNVAHSAAWKRSHGISLGDIRRR